MKRVIPRTDVEKEYLAAILGRGENWFAFPFHITNGDVSVAAIITHIKNRWVATEFYDTRNGSCRSISVGQAAHIMKLPAALAYVLECAVTFAKDGMSQEQWEEINACMDGNDGFVIDGRRVSLEKCAGMLKDLHSLPWVPEDDAPMALRRKRKHKNRTA